MGVLVVKMHPPRAQEYFKRTTAMHNHLKHLDKVHREIVFLGLSRVHLEPGKHCAAE